MSMRMDMTACITASPRSQAPFLELVKQAIQRPFMAEQLLVTPSGLSQKLLNEMLIRNGSATPRYKITIQSWPQAWEEWRQRSE